MLSVKAANSSLSQSAPLGRKESPTDITCVVSTRRRVPTNWVSDRTLQPSTDPVVAIFSVPSDFLVQGHASNLETVHPFSVLGSTAFDFYLS